MNTQENKNNNSYVSIAESEYLRLDNRETYEEPEIGKGFLKDIISKQFSWNEPELFIFGKCKRDGKYKAPENYAFNVVTKNIRPIPRLPIRYGKNTVLINGRHIFMFNGFYGTKVGNYAVNNVAKDHVSWFDIRHNTWESNIFNAYTKRRLGSITLKHPGYETRAVQIGGRDTANNLYGSFITYDLITLRHYKSGLSPRDREYNIENGILQQNSLYLFLKEPQFKCFNWDPRDSGGFSTVFDSKFEIAKTNYSLAKKDYYIYIIGGDLYDVGTGGERKTKEVLEFDIRSNNIRPLKNMPHAKQNPAVCIYENQLFVFGGGGNNSARDRYLNIYNFENDGWRVDKDVELPQNIAINCFAFNENYKI
uniref:Galactose oxidase n=1 Tax=Parastrongyloides trichosuri TaxID=131310 RepID=A0A0N4Z002_PARTI